MSLMSHLSVSSCHTFLFQHFVKPEDASAALNALDDSEFLNSHIQVQVWLSLCLISHFVLYLFVIVNYKHMYVCVHLDLRCTIHMRFVTCSPPFQLLHTSSLARKVTDTDEEVDHRDHDSVEEG